MSNQDPYGTPPEQPYGQQPYGQQPYAGGQGFGSGPGGPGYPGAPPPPPRSGQA